MGFFAGFLGPLPLGLDLGFTGVCVGVALGRGRNSLLVGPFFLIIRFRVVDGASIFSIPKASQKLPISLRVFALSPYFACNFNSLHKLRPSDLMTPNNCPKVNKLNGLSLVKKFCRNLLRILSPNNFGRPAIKRSFQKFANLSSLLRTLVRKTSLYQR